MMFVLLLMLFIVYHIAVFAYSEVLLEPKDKKWRFRLITCIINGSLISLYYYFGFHESVFFIVFTILLYYEFRIGYQGGHLKSLFGSLCFGVNFFAVRLVMKAIYSIVNDTAFYLSTTDMNINMLCTIVTFLFCTIYIVFFRYILTKRYMRTIQSSEENIKFASNILLSIFIFQVFNTINLYVQESYLHLAWLQLKIGVCAMFGFIAAVLYAYLLSRLAIFRNISEEMEDQIFEQNKESENLKNIAFIDQDLGCYSRTYGMMYLEETITMNRDYFSVVFFDLDGLKLVNDKYGHYEGDLYIQNVVKVFNGVFKDHMICRMGGDEFMVVLRGVNEFDAYKYAVKVYEKVEAKSLNKAQKYNMSVSYGLLEVNVKHKLVSDKILKIVDEKMYVFKNDRKKARFM